MAAAQLMLGVLSNEISAHKPKPVPIIATRTTHPELLASPKSASQEFTTQDRINAIERELFYLRGRGADKRPRNRDKDRNNNATSEEDEDACEAREPTKKTKLVPEVVIPQFKETPKPRAIIESTSEEAEGTSDTEHPFADAPDAAYAAPANRNFGAPPKAPPAKKPTPAYRTIAPVYDDKVAEVAFDKAMSSLVTITQRELLSLSPEV